MVVSKKILFLSVFSLIVPLLEKPIFADAEVIHEKSWGLTTLLSPTEFKSTLSVENHLNLDASTITENRFASLTERVLEFRNGIGDLTGIARIRPWGDEVIRFYRIDHERKEVFVGSFLHKNGEGRLYNDEGQEVAYSLVTQLRDQVVAYQVRESSTEEILIEATRSRESASTNKWTIQGTEFYVPLIVAQIVYDTIRAYRVAEAKIGLIGAAAGVVGLIGYQGTKHAGLLKFKNENEPPVRTEASDQIPVGAERDRREQQLEKHVLEMFTELMVALSDKTSSSEVEQMTLLVVGFRDLLIEEQVKYYSNLRARYIAQFEDILKTTYSLHQNSTLVSVLKQLDDIKTSFRPVIAGKLGPLR